MKCPDCGSGVCKKYCTSCGRFVPTPLKKWALDYSVIATPSLLLLIVFGYIYFPVLGFLSEVFLWIWVGKYDRSDELTFTLKGFMQAFVVAVVVFAVTITVVFMFAGK